MFSTFVSLARSGVDGFPAMARAAQAQGAITADELVSVLETYKNARKGVKADRRSVAFRDLHGVIARARLAGIADLVDDGSGGAVLTAPGIQPVVIPATQLARIATVLRGIFAAQAAVASDDDNAADAAPASRAG